MNVGDYESAGRKVNLLDRYSLGDVMKNDRKKAVPAKPVPKVVPTKPAAPAKSASLAMQLAALHVAEKAMQSAIDKFDAAADVSGGHARRR